ncbi:MAG: DUF262 domain-containing protein [Bacteroidales bacterium]|jgi:hypothetical protein|nr:DUF262 domain-containing protein [Bacteroidales bacterium]
MTYKIDDLNALEIKNCRFVDKILEAIDENGNKFEVHSSQLSERAADSAEPFTLKQNHKAFVDIASLSISNNMLETDISFRFVIPAFQRGYRWNIEMINDLIEDIYANFKKYPNDDRVMKYCIQPLVVKGSATGLNEYRVIDGQQRLTTLSLMLSALNALTPRSPSIAVKNAYIPIDYESRPESGIFLNCIQDITHDVLENIKKEIHSGNIGFKTTLERIEKSEQLLKTPDSLDSQFMLKGYIYLYWYLYEKIYEENKYNGENYFYFIEKDWPAGQRKNDKRFELFEKMILERTSIIWYEIAKKDMDEHRIFENFNSGKIELTGAELIKGVFMNPDNYITEAVDDVTGSVISRLKEKQTMIGSQWDEMETALHNSAFWDFIPHLEETQGNLDGSTRIDSIFNIFVYFSPGNKDLSFDFNEQLSAFKQLNALIERQQDALASDNERFTEMQKLWTAVRDVYITFKEWFEGDTFLKNKNEIYHRLSLFKRLIVNRQQNRIQWYQAEMRGIRDIYTKLQSAKKSERIKIINEAISDYFISLCKKNSLKESLSGINYYGGREVESALIAFNLATLESAKGFGGRFPFEAYKKNNWEKEHIFAGKTIIAGMDSEKREAFIDALLSTREEECFKKYHYFINGGDLDNENSYENFLAFDKMPPDYRNMKDDLNTILLLDKESDNYRIHVEELFKDDGVVMNYLNDTYMGNMSLLTKPDNIKVSNYSYLEKCKMIKDMFVKGEFIPICTMNVFCDFYSEEPGYNDYWLYSKRFPYILQMFQMITGYLE